jgi:hypothetical protein
LTELKSFLLLRDQQAYYVLRPENGKNINDLLFHKKTVQTPAFSTFKHNFDFFQESFSFKPDLTLWHSSHPS